MHDKILATLESLRSDIRDELKKSPLFQSLIAIERSIAEIRIAYGETSGEPLAALTGSGEISRSVAVGAAVDASAETAIAEDSVIEDLIEIDAGARVVQVGGEADVDDGEAEDEDEEAEAEEDEDEFAEAAADEEAYGLAEDGITGDDSDDGGAIEAAGQPVANAVEEEVAEAGDDGNVSPDLEDGDADEEIAGEETAGEGTTEADTSDDVAYQAGTDGGLGRVDDDAGDAEGIGAAAADVEPGVGPDGEADEEDEARPGAGTFATAADGDYESDLAARIAQAVAQVEPRSAFLEDARPIGATGADGEMPAETGTVHADEIVEAPGTSVAPEVEAPADIGMVVEPGFETVETAAAIDHWGPGTVPDEIEASVAVTGPEPADAEHMAAETGPIAAEAADIWGTGLPAETVDTAEMTEVDAVATEPADPTETSADGGEAGAFAMSATGADTAAIEEAAAETETAAIVEAAADETAEAIEIDTTETVPGADHPDDGAADHAAAEVAEAGAGEIQTEAAAIEETAAEGEMAAAGDIPAGDGIAVDTVAETWASVPAVAIVPIPPDLPAAPAPPPLPQAAAPPVVSAPAPRGPGYLPTRPQPNATFYFASADLYRQPLPKAVDLRPALAPVIHQGASSVEVADAVAAAVDALIAVSGGSGWASRRFVDFNTRLRMGTTNPAVPLSIQAAIEAVIRFGASSEEACPWQPELLGERPAAEAYTVPPAVVIGGLQQVPLNLNAWRQALAEGKVIVFGLAFIGDPDDCTSLGGVVPMVRPEAAQAAGSATVRALACVGYNDQEKVFIVRNCWGEDWGDGGYAYLPYNTVMCKKFVDSDCWVLVPVQPTALPKGFWSDGSMLVTDAGRGIGVETNPIDAGAYWSVSRNFVRDGMGPYVPATPDFARA